MRENNDLGQESVGKLLLKFAVPSTLALIISCLYNIVDQIFVICAAYLKRSRVFRVKESDFIPGWR